jgi:hypothetical protein
MQYFPGCGAYKHIAVSRANVAFFGHANTSNTKDPKSTEGKTVQFCPGGEACKRGPRRDLVWSRHGAGDRRHPRAEDDGAQVELKVQL